MSDEDQRAIDASIAARNELQLQCGRLSHELADAKGELAKRAGAMDGILAEMRERRLGYRTMWGAPSEENYPDFDPNDADYLPDVWECERRFHAAQLAEPERETWMHFLAYEFSGLVARLREGAEVETVRSGVIDVAVECLAWVEAIDRRKAAT